MIYMIMVMKNVSMMAGPWLVSVMGPGGYSIDGRAALAS
jgi:uncharacterized membrane protein YphA (DoxX/SURF4 family)